MRLATMILVAILGLGFVGSSTASAGTHAHSKTSLVKKTGKKGKKGTGKHKHHKHKHHHKKSTTQPTA